MRIPEAQVWTTDRAEEAISEVAGVDSVRLVEDGKGVIREIHVLATSQVSARRIVDDIESTLFVHFGKSVDRRKISVAQTHEVDIRDRLKKSTPTPPPNPSAPGRMVLVGHQVVGERSQRVDVRVSLEWNGARVQGSATGADIAHHQLEALARATLRAVETAAESASNQGTLEPVSLHLDGVSVVTGFGAPSALVSVTAICGRETFPLAGAVSVEDSTQRAVVLATLQATDRWIRGRSRS